MTFEEWLQQKRDYVRDNFPSGFDEIVASEADLAEEAWDAAMEEAARRLFAEAVRLDGIGLMCFAADAMAIRRAAHGCLTTSGATPGPPAGEPGAGSPASGAPSPGPRREPG